MADRDRTWPDDWAQRMDGAGCPICPALGGGDNDYWVAVHVGKLAEAYLERRTRVAGYCVVVWRHGHVAEPTELDAGPAAGYWREVLDVGRAVEAEFRPLKLNYLTLGNSVPHLHTHVVPRYPDDPAPGGPLPWDALVGPDPVPESDLHAQAAALRRRLAG